MFSSAAFNCAVVETRGRRDTHQDAHSVSCTDQRADFWVLDGHRGAAAAHYGAEALKKEIGETIKSGRLPSDGRILQSFRTIDNRLRKYLKEKSKESKSGSTVVGALVARDGPGSYSAKLVNCGDSRAIIIKDPAIDKTGRSATVLETVDHKPDHPGERDRVLAAGGTVSGGRCPRVDGRLAVSRSLGDFEFKADKGRQAAQQKVSCVPDIYETSGLEPGTLVLLACDGVWGAMSTELVADRVRSKLRLNPKANLGEVAASIVTESLERGSTDNLTVLLVRLAECPPQEAANTVSVAAEVPGEKVPPDVVQALSVMAGG